MKRYKKHKADNGLIHSAKNFNEVEVKSISPRQQAYNKQIITNDINDPRLKAYQDSLFLYNNSKQVQDYYKQKGYNTEMGKVPNNYFDLGNKNREDFSKLFSEAVKNKKTSGDSYPTIIKNDTLNTLIRNETKTHVSNWHSSKWSANTPMDYSTLFLKYIKKINEKHGEMVGTGDMAHMGYLDYNAPVQYIHPRIKPTRVYKFEKQINKNNTDGDVNVDIVFSYDPMKIKPKREVNFDPNYKEPSNPVFKKPIVNPSSGSVNPIRPQVNRPQVNQSSNEKSLINPMHVPNGWEQPDPNYPTLKIRINQQGKATHIVNSIGETLPYIGDQAPYSAVTKEFAYPKFAFPKRKIK